MKKALVMLLAVVLVIGMAVPAYAVSGPVGDKTSSTATADLPKLMDESKGYVELVATEVPRSCPRSPRRSLLRRRLP